MDYQAGWESLSLQWEQYLADREVIKHQSEHGTEDFYVVWYILVSVPIALLGIGTDRYCY